MYRIIGRRLRTKDRIILHNRSHRSDYHLSRDENGGSFSLVFFFSLLLLKKRERDLSRLIVLYLHGKFNRLIRGTLPEYQTAGTPISAQQPPEFLRNSESEEDL